MVARTALTVHLRIAAMLMAMAMTPYMGSHGLFLGGDGLIERRTMSESKYTDEQVLDFIVLRQAGDTVEGATTTLGLPASANGSLRDRAYALGLTTPEEMAVIAAHHREGQTG